MKSRIRWIGCLVVGILGAGVSVAGDAAAVNAALKRISKATKGLRGVVAEAEFSEIAGDRSIEGAGKLYVHHAGVARAEIASDSGPSGSGRDGSLSLAPATSSRRASV